MTQKVYCPLGTGSSKEKLLLVVMPANTDSKSLPLHWPVWLQDTEGCGDHGGALSSEAGALPAPARAASCGELTPAPTHHVAGCSGYADALGVESQDKSVKLFAPPPPGGVSPTSRPKLEAPHSAPSCSGVKNQSLDVPSANQPAAPTRACAFASRGLAGWARRPGGRANNFLREGKARLRVPESRPPGRYRSLGRLWP